MTMLATNEAAFADDLRDVTPRLRRFAFTLTRNGDAADDLVQDTLLKAWRARERFEPGTNLKAWTFTILKRTFLSQNSRRRFHAEYDELVAERMLATPEAQTLAIEVADVRAAVDLLPAAHREALLLVADHGLEYSVAADRAGVSLAAFKSRVHRARIALLALLDRSALPIQHIQPALRSARKVVTPGRYRRTWAEAKAAGRPLMIGRAGL